MTLDNGCHPDVRVIKIAETLLQHDNEVTVLAWERTPEKYGYTGKMNFEIINGISIIRFLIPSKGGTGFRQIPSLLSFRHQVRQHLAKHNYDVIHMNDLIGIFVGINFIRRMKAYFVDLHEYFIGERNFLKILTKFVLRKIISNSQCTFIENGNYFDDYNKISGKLVMIRNYPTAGLLSPFKSETEYLRIGYFGSIRGQIPHFSALFLACNNFKGKVKIFIRGTVLSSEEEEWKYLCSRFNYVHYDGPYNGFKDSSDLYSSVDLIFCPYDNSNPNFQGDAEVVKYYEAIQSGTPLIVSSGIGLEKKVIENSYGYVVDTTNIQQIEQLLISIIGDVDLYNKIRRKMLLDSSRYLWENESTKLIQEYKRMISK